MIVIVHIKENLEERKVNLSVEVPEGIATELEIQTYYIFKEFMVEFYSKIGTPGTARGFLNNNQN